MKKVKFYNSFEGDKICEGILEEDPMFIGGYKITYKEIHLPSDKEIIINERTGIPFLKTKKNEKEKND